MLNMETSLHKHKTELESLELKGNCRHSSIPQISTLSLYTILASDSADYFCSCLSHAILLCWRKHISLSFPMHRACYLNFEDGIVSCNFIRTACAKELAVKISLGIQGSKVTGDTYVWLLAN